jgi:hypothetical protein
MLRSGQCDPQVVVIPQSPRLQAAGFEDAAQGAGGRGRGAVAEGLPGRTGLQQQTAVGEADAVGDARWTTRRTSSTATTDSPTTAGQPGRRLKRPGRSRQ